jgi:hypothetical protein
VNRASQLHNGRAIRGDCYEDRDKKASKFVQVPHQSKGVDAGEAIWVESNF